MVKFLIGLPVLGIVVFIHELGHFIAAKLCGVSVESFSIGWGPVLLHKKFGATDYRLSAIPLGGYCGMKGEHAFREAYEKKLPSVPKEEGSLFAAHPFKRILIAFAGPFANLLLAAAALAMISGLGRTYYTTDNRIVPVYCLDSSDQSPARTAGLQIGDRILQINDQKTANFADIQQIIALHPEESLTMLIERGGEQLSMTIRPDLNKKTGAGQVGIYRYVPLEVASVRKDSAADLAGIKAGDRLTGFIASLRQGIVQTGELTAVTLKSLGLLFKGVNMTDAVAGPVRISSMIGSLAADGFSENTRAGFVNIAEIVAVICVSLFLMNLLPIPILDGGLIFTAFIECIVRRQIPPRGSDAIQRSEGLKGSA